ncbi:hypothetical protein TWF970_006777 [Orbilia oligospora]|uniref:SWI/SNF and RSC complexes subunit Ssr4 C-terminal domain-containing protein n=1 Tax=Orbilia oligospora TaxID=2813651 RepID=A0A7C8VBA5_ORBOL|nr:hypothetical protein TWF970_006777 [Orbilia oligospora]
MMPQNMQYYSPHQVPPQYMQQHHQPHPQMMQTPTRPHPQRGQPTPAPHYAMGPQMIPQTPAGPSTAKRQRTSQSMASAGPTNPMMAAAMDSVEDEEDTSRGDVLDHIPPRELATQRYKQHHEWLEQVVSSTHNISNIEPGSIGIELLGSWLKPLVEGIFEKDGKPSNGQSLRGAVSLMTERFDKNQSDLNAEIEEMQRKHQLELQAFAKMKRLGYLINEVRSIPPTPDEIKYDLVTPAPADPSHQIPNARPLDAIIQEFETMYDCKVVDREMVHVMNPQPELAEYEEQQKAAQAAQAAQQAAQQAAAAQKAAAEAAAAATTASATTSSSSSANNAADSNGQTDQNADKMAGVAQVESAQPPPVANAPASNSTEDTPMTDAEPIPATTSTSHALPVQPQTHVQAQAQAPGSSIGTPGLSPFAIPSPSPAFPTGPSSRNPTPGLPTPLPATAEPGKSATPNPLQQASTPGKLEEPPTVPGEENILEGMTGGDDVDDFDFVGGGGAAAEVMDLLGAEESFTDQFM